MTYSVCELKRTLQCIPRQVLIIARLITPEKCKQFICDIVLVERIVENGLSCTCVSIIGGCMFVLIQYDANFQVDAEGSECKIFDERTAARFMAEVDVIAFQMEWQWMLLGLIKPQDVNRLLKFIGSRNYTVHAIADGMPMVHATDWTRWPGDVMFMKQYS